MDIINLPTYEQYDVRLQALSNIASNLGGIKLNSWKDVQRIVRMGLADKLFTVGDQFTSSYGDSIVTWDIIGIDHDIPSDKKYTHSLTLQSHDCICNAQFDNPEALYKVKDSALAIGTYNFTYNKTTYQFTTTQSVPVGGVLCFPWASNTDILTAKIKTYSSNASTTVIEELSISVGSSGTTLTPINDISQCRYGSNNYVNSAIRQWLNSNATTFTWTPKTDYDRIPTGTPYDGAGFLKNLDTDLVAVLGAVDKQVAKNTVTDGGGQDTFSDTVFLLSKKEVYGGDEGVVTGENLYAYYEALADSPTSDALAGRIKYLGSSARYWWLRSPYLDYSYYVRGVSTSGDVYRYYVYSTFGIAPACCII